MKCQAIWVGNVRDWKRPECIEDKYYFYNKNKECNLVYYDKMC